MYDTGDDSWQAELTPHKLSHSSLWAYLTQGLTLLGNLCGLAAIIKEVAAVLSQARKSVKSLSPWQQHRLSAIHADYILLLAGNNTSIMAVQLYLILAISSHLLLQLHLIRVTVTVVSYFIVFG